MKKLVILDAGHGDPPLTGGKCSPDRKLLEYYWARDMVQRIAAKLKAKGVDVHILVPENTDTPLDVRIARVNKLCNQHGSSNCLLVSVHNNASGIDGQWHEPNGWCVFVAKVASANSKLLAKLLYSEAIKARLQGNRSVPQEHYWQNNFAIIRKTQCPAVLTENLFMDNQNDCAYLLSEVGKETLANMHVNGIMNYIAQAK